MAYHLMSDAGRWLLMAGSLAELAESVRGRLSLGWLLPGRVYQIAGDSGLVRLRSRGADLAAWVDTVRATGVWPLDPDEPLRSATPRPAFDGGLAWNPEFAAMG